METPLEDMFWFHQFSPLKWEEICVYIYSQEDSEWMKEPGNCSKANSTSVVKGISESIHKVPDMVNESRSA